MQYFTTLKSIVVITLFFIALQQINAQDTISTGALWQDATIRTSPHPQEPFASTNYGWWARGGATAWTHDSYQVVYRALTRFDLSYIPPGSTITSATLQLYSDPNYQSGEYSNVSLTSNNSVFFQRVTQPWDATTVTWNNQPPTTTTDRIWLPVSSSPIENLQIDITAWAQDMVNNPSSNYGFMMLLENEIYYSARNYASSDNANSSIHPKVIIYYTNPAPPLKQRMDYIFGGLNQSEIYTGILTDYGLDLAEAEEFDGVVSAENAVDMTTWRSLYASLLTSVINPSSSMIHLKTINTDLENNWATTNKSNPLIDVPVMFVEYQTLREDALDQNLLSVSNDRLADVYPVSTSPYLTKYAFAAAPYLNHDSDGNVTFIFRSNLYIESSNKNLASLEVDFADGSGYQTVTFDTPIQVNYSTSGEKDIQYKLQTLDFSTYYSHSKFNVYIPNESNNVQARYSGIQSREFIFPRSADATCPENYPDPEPLNGAVAGATVTVEYGGNRPTPGCTPTFIRPLIVVEGFDVSKFGEFGESNWDYDSFILSSSNGGINLLVPAGGSLNDQLDNLGYDIVFVDFNNGTGDIVQNAFLVENIIQWVNAHKIVNPNTGNREETVVLGQSMGGLVARYAVSDLEKRWLENSTVTPHHEVRLLVTQDTPHRGANIPLGFQALVKDLAPQNLTKLGLTTFGVVGLIVGSYIDMGDVVPALKAADKLLDEPASRQMLIYQDGQTNTFLDGPYRNMVTFNSGYTPSFDMRAISNGSECGIGQQLQPAGEILNINANAYVNRFVFAVVAETVTNLINQTTVLIPGAPPGIGAITRIPFYVLAPFTGKRWKTAFNVKATPATGTNKAFTGSIKFDKRVLAIIPITITLFEGNRDSQAGALPIDSSPGGYYDLHQFKTMIPQNPNINSYPIVEANLNVRLANTFNFVPTFSALDVETTITPPVLSSIFTGGSNPTYPSRFPNFITQEKSDQDNAWQANNSRHIGFTARSGTWLLNLVEGTETTSTCSYGCPTAISPATISGVDQLCLNSEVYNINNIPVGISVNWSTTGTFQTVGGNFQNSITVSPTGNQGNGSVRAMLEGNTCAALTISKPLTLGSPPWPPYSVVANVPEYFEPGSSYGFTANQSIFITVNPYPYMVSGAQVYWNVGGAGTANVVPYGNGADITFNSGGGYTIAVSTTGPCGTVFASNNVQVSGFGFSSIADSEYSYYPNPVTDNLQIGNSLSSQEVAAKSNFNQSVGEVKFFQVNLYDGSGNLMRSSRATKEQLISIDTKELSSGTYYLHVMDGDNTYREPIVVKH